MGPQQESCGADGLLGTHGKKDGKGGHLSHPRAHLPKFRLHPHPPPPLPPGVGAPRGNSPGAGGEQSCGITSGRAPQAAARRGRGEGTPTSALTGPGWGGRQAPQAPPSPRRSPSLPVRPRGAVPGAAAPRSHGATWRPFRKTHSPAAGRAARGRGNGGRERHPHTRLSPHPAAVPCPGGCCGTPRIPRVLAQPAELPVVGEGRGLAVLG